jgi:hypothetical protein
MKYDGVSIFLLLTATNTETKRDKPASLTEVSAKRYFMITICITTTTYATFKYNATIFLVSSRCVTSITVKINAV